ncbi:hypothetical protein [Pseudomonas poae]|uniref:hypothetical protein n=1 Tax=Pseudomonas poae TaxID=200451 RepID=UPI001644DFE0|nr:hypothetical protein [Pseudomonas poae]MBC3199583.1 hypothetical protein [Pseudomonas poae]
MLKFLKRVFNVLYPDRRPDWEQKRERKFILAANGLKTLSVTDRGGMSIDPKELRDQIIAAREQLKHLVHKPGAPGRTLNISADLKVAQETNDALEAAVEPQDCIEVVAWRRLRSGAAGRYVCLQSTTTGRFAVATARLFSMSEQSLPSWMEANTDRHVANAIQNAELRWFTTVSDAMDAWDAEL